MLEEFVSHQTVSHLILIFLSLILAKLSDELTFSRCILPRHSFKIVFKVELIVTSYDTASPNIILDVAL